MRSVEAVAIVLGRKPARTPQNRVALWRPTPSGFAAGHGFTFGRYLERAGYVVMKKPPLGGHSGIGWGLGRRISGRRACKTRLNDGHVTLMHTPFPLIFVITYRTTS